jgi:coenzyme F420-reducing hydrogenase gamma subunit
VTQTGCGALCPRFGRGCFGCYGPMETPNTRALSRQLAELGMDEEALKRVYSTFNVNAEAFREEMKRHGS